MRFPDWPERLAAFIEERRYTPFQYGVNDCSIFAADAVQVMTGLDPAEQYRGSYSTKLGAARLLNRLGGLDGALSMLEPVPVLMAGRGDIVMVNAPEGDALAVCLGNVAAAPGENGLVFVPLSSFVKAWRGYVCLK